MARDYRMEQGHTLSLAWVLAMIWIIIAVLVLFALRKLAKMSGSWYD